MPFTLHTVFRLMENNVSMCLLLFGGISLTKIKTTFGKPVQVWKLNKHASCGPALFMPVQIIAQKLRVYPPALKLQGLASLCYNCFIDSCNIRGAFGCYHSAVFN